MQKLFLFLSLSPPTSFQKNKGRKKSQSFGVNIFLGGSNEKGKFCANAWESREREKYLWVLNQRPKLSAILVSRLRSFDKICGVLEHESLRRAKIYYYINHYKNQKHGSHFYVPCLSLSSSNWFSDNLCALRKCKCQQLSRYKLVVYKFIYLYIYKYNSKSFASLNH